MITYDKKRRLVILEEPTATKDLTFFDGDATYAKVSYLIGILISGEFAIMRLQN